MTSYSSSPGFFSPEIYQSLYLGHTHVEMATNLSICMAYHCGTNADNNKHHTGKRRMLKCKFSSATERGISRADAHSCYIVYMVNLVYVYAQQRDHLRVLVGLARDCLNVSSSWRFGLRFT